MEITYSKINNNFFKQSTLNVCENLIGCKIVCKTPMGKVEAIITEVEGYLGVHDKACHTYGNRKTNRTKVMYEEGGMLYVYFVYGMHYNINFVTENYGTPTAILLRGIKIITGADVASNYRFGKNYDQLNNYQKANISNGPGKVAQCFNITKEQNNINFKNVFIILQPNVKQNYTTAKRIGVNYAGEDANLPYRYILTS